MTAPGPAVTQVVVQLDLAEPHEVAEWRQAMEQDASDDARAALDALDSGELVLGSLYVEATFGPGDEDAVGLTIAGVELRRDEDPVAQVDDDWIADALAECGDQLADEQDLHVSEAELREVLTVQASAEVLAALSRE